MFILNLRSESWLGVLKRSMDDFTMRSGHLIGLLPERHIFTTGVAQSSTSRLGRKRSEALPEIPMLTYFA